MRLCILLIAILAITFIYVSCNKHTIQKPTENINMVMSGWAHSTDPELQTQFSFDESRHVIKEETGNEISSYEFMNDSIIIREFNKEENRYIYEFKGKLDNHKRLVSGVATSSYIPSTPDTVQHAFEYNKEGYLQMETRLSPADDTFLIKYEYEGNMVKKILTYSNSELYNTKELAYYDNDLSCNLPEEFKFRKNINNLVGRSSQQPIEKIVSTGRNGKQKYILNYEYKTDENGYAFQVIGKKGKKVSGVVTYFYASTLNAANESVAIAPIN